MGLSDILNGVYQTQNQPIESQAMDATALPAKSLAQILALVYQAKQNAQKTWDNPEGAANNLIAQYTPTPDNLGNFILGGPAIIGQLSPLYHGSPYKFNKFKNESIGTGEGAQAFGYGHYLTDEPNIAKVYSGRRPGENVIPPNSYIYTTTVNKGKPSSSDVFLEWGSPIDESAKNKIASFIESRYSKENPIRTELEKALKTPFISGDDIYRRVERVLGGGVREAPKQTSNLLKEIGFTGIKYPAGSLSGVKNSKANNYVIFDPENITIDKVE